MTSLALLLLLQSPGPPPPKQPWFPEKSGCSHCGPERSQGPLSSARVGLTTKAALALGLASGAGIGQALGGTNGDSALSDPGTMMTGKSTLILWGGVGALAATRVFFLHGPEEPPLVTAPWRSLREPWAPDRAVRNGTAGRLSPKTRRVMDSLSWLTLGQLAAQPLGIAAAGPTSAKDTLVAYEAAALAYVATDQLKHIVHRPRPFAYYCEPLDEKALGGPDAQWSFPSGHTSTAFALAAATAGMASYRQLPNATTIRGVSYSLAGATGLLRILADKHYTTDVLAGGALGWLTGWAVAKLHSSAAESQQGEARPAAIDFSLPVADGTLVSAKVGGGFALSVTVLR